MKASDRPNRSIFVDVVARWPRGMCISTTTVAWRWRLCAAQAPRCSISPITSIAEHGVRYRRGQASPDASEQTDLRAPRWL